MCIRDSSDSNEASSVVDDTDADPDYLPQSSSELSSFRFESSVQSVSSKPFNRLSSAGDPSQREENLIKYVLAISCENNIYQSSSTTDPSQHLEGNSVHSDLPISSNNDKNQSPVAVDLCEQSADKTQTICTRKRPRDPNEWVKVKAKILRNAGKEYVSCEKTKK